MKKKFLIFFMVLLSFNVFSFENVKIKFWNELKYNFWIVDCFKEKYNQTKVDRYNILDVQLGMQIKFWDHFYLGGEATIPTQVKYSPHIEGEPLELDSHVFMGFEGIVKNFWKFDIALGRSCEHPIVPFFKYNKKYTFIDRGNIYLTIRNEIEF